MSNYSREEERVPVQEHSHQGDPDRMERSYWASRAFLIFLAFGAMATVLLWSEHRAHLLGILPVLFLLACPLLHIFGGHGPHSAHGGDGRKSPSDSKRGQP